MKTKKALTKRVKITKNRKVMRRPLGQAHYNAKETGQTTRRKRGRKGMSKVERNFVKKLVPGF